MAYLDNTGLAYFWGKIKAWANSVFALLGHVHPSSDVTSMAGYSKPSSSSAIAAADTLNQAVGKLEKGLETVDGNAVHKTGNESVAGKKTFTAATVVVRNELATRGVIPQHSLFNDVLFCDASGAEWDISGAHGRIGAVQTEYAPASSSARVKITLTAYDNIAGNSDYSALAVGFDSQGRKFAQAPQTDPARAGVSDILTRSWDGYLVHKASAETITGQKTFSDTYIKHVANNPVIAQTNNVLHRGANTSTALGVYNYPLFVSDAEGHPAVAVYHRVVKDSSGNQISNNINFICWDYKTTDNRNVQLGVGFDENNNPYSYAPSTRTDRTNGGDIVTRDWLPVDTRLLHSSGDEVVDNVKAFNSFIVFRCGTSVPKGTTPSSIVWFPGVSFQDSSSGYDTSTTSRFANLSAAVDASGATQISLSAFKNVADTAVNNYMSVICRQDEHGLITTSTEEFLFKKFTYCIRSDGSNDKVYGSLQFYAGNNAFDGASIQLFSRANTSYAGQFYLRASTKSAWNSSGDSRDLVGKPDGSLTWNGQTIQTTSDERLKTSLAQVPDGVLDAWDGVDWGQFQFLDAVEEKGASARLHLGLIAQAVQRAFKSRGLDGCAYGILCHERRDAAFTERTDADGSRVRDVEPAVDLWTVRYAEALSMEAAYQRRENARLKERVADLEERLAALELKIS